MPDVRDLPLGRFCNFIWWVMARNLETPAEVAKLRATLWRPPPGMEPTRGPWTPEAEMSAFNSLRAGLGK